MAISFSCEVSRPQGYYSNDNSTTLGLLDRLRSIPGLRIGGVGERDAQVYLRGQTSIKYYQEVVFYVNGARVGNYSSAYQVVQPENIDSIKLLKKGGYLIINVPAFSFLNSNFDKDVGHYRRYSKSDFKKNKSHHYSCQ